MPELERIPAAPSERSSERPPGSSGQEKGARPFGAPRREPGRNRKRGLVLCGAFLGTLLTLGPTIDVLQSYVPRAYAVPIGVLSTLAVTLFFLNLYYTRHVLDTGVAPVERGPSSAGNRRSGVRILDRARFFERLSGWTGGYTLVVLQIEGAGVDGPALAELEDHLRDDVREVDVVGRMGNATYAVALEGVPPKSPTERVRRLRSRLRELESLHAGSRPRLGYEASAEGETDPRAVYARAHESMFRVLPARRPERALHAA